MDPDEGINLMKALLQLRGYELYADIYSDQPPLFTLFLTALFWLFEPNVTLARLGVLELSLLLVGAVVWYLNVNWGLTHSVLGFLILILLPDFARFSVSVMIGLPSISLAFVSFALAVDWIGSGRRLSLVLSGIMISAAMLIKGIVAPFGPLVGLAILLRNIRTDRPIREQSLAFKPFLLWSAVAGGLLLIGALAIGPQHWQQLTASHLQANEVQTFISRAEKDNINSYLNRAWGIVILGGIGSLYAIVHKRFMALPLTVWGVGNYIFLANTIPVWEHHHLLVSIPAAVLAALPTGDAVSATIASIKGRQFLHRRFIFGAAMLALFVGLMIPIAQLLSIELDPKLTNFVRGPQHLSLDFIHYDEMYELRGDDEVVVTDRPMYAFRMGKIVPPTLAVWSQKRFETGEVTLDQVIEEIEEWEPTQVLIGRFLAKELEAYLVESGEYIREYHYGDFRLYQRKPE